MDDANVHLCAGNLQMSGTKVHVDSVHPHLGAASINTSTQKIRIARDHLMTLTANVRLHGHDMAIRLRVGGRRIASDASPAAECWHGHPAQTSDGFMDVQQG